MAEFRRDLDEAVRDCGLFSSSAAAVLLSLSSRRNYSSGLCNPSHGCLERDTRLSEKTVKRALAELKRLGAIRILGGGDGRRSLEYELNDVLLISAAAAVGSARGHQAKTAVIGSIMTSLENRARTALATDDGSEGLSFEQAASSVRYGDTMSDQTPHRSPCADTVSGQKSVENSPSRGVTVTPLQDRGGSSRPPRGSMVTPQGGHSDPQTLKEPSKEPYGTMPDHPVWRAIARATDASFTQKLTEKFDLSRIRPSQAFRDGVPGVEVSLSGGGSYSLGKTVDYLNRQELTLEHGEPILFTTEKPNGVHSTNVIPFRGAA